MSIRADFIIDQGTDFATVINLEDDNDVPIDLSSYTGIAQIRRHPTSSTFYNFIVTLMSNGTITLGMNDTVTSSIPEGRYQYDCLITDSNDKTTKIVYGVVEIKGRISR